MRKKNVFILITTTSSTLLGIFSQRLLAQSATSFTNKIPISIPRDYAKTIIVGIFIIVLVILFICCIGIMMFSKDKEKVVFASDVIKTLAGFFIGAITGYLG